MPLESAQVLRRDGVWVGPRRLVALALAFQLERTPYPLDVDADYARAFALTPEGRDREPREVAHLAVRAGADGLADPVAQRLEVEALAALEALLAEAALDRLALGGAEEEALEDELEDAPVIL